MTEEGSSRPGRTAEPPDPEDFSVWYEGKKALAALRKKLFEEDSLRRSLAPQARIEELQDAVTRGKEARRFLASGFWQEDLEPFLKAEAVLRPWTPKDGILFSFARLLVEYVFGSGQMRVLVRLMERMNQWDRDGLAAEKFLLEEAEKRKRAGGIAK